MKNPNNSSLVVGGIGITSAIGQGKAAFIAGLLAGQHRFDVMRRPGRQLPSRSLPEQIPLEPSAPFLGAEIPALSLPGTLAKSGLRTASFSAQVALATLNEAWQDAGLASVASERIGLIIGGSNVQQRELVQLQDSYRDRQQFLRPTYGLAFMDSDLCGLCTEAFGIQGFAYTVGGASASGQLAIIEAAHAVQSGRVDVCIALGAMMDISYWECQGLRSLGAMGSDRYASEPALACRPFDKNSDGFIFGEMCGAIVIERSPSLLARGRHPYARLSGWGVHMDANRHPNPSMEGEMLAIKTALRKAHLTAQYIDYVNPHGTGSALGDKVELESLRRSGLSHAYLNTTKSITGHGLSAAGAVEAIALLLQMQASKLHPIRNLENPIDADFNWVGKDAISHQVEHALSLSMGFGGINTAICWHREP